MHIGCKVFATISFPLIYVMKWFWGDCTVTVHVDPPVVLVGQAAMLSCHLTGQVPTNIQVHWYKLERNKNTTLYFYNSTEKGTELGRAGDQHRIKERYENGDVKVKLFPVQVEDSGQYVCAVTSDGVYQEAIAQVIVAGFGSAPQLTIEHQQNNSTTLRCVSQGWYPQPEVRWTDSTGRNITAVAETRIQKDVTDLYQIHSTLRVADTASDTISCAIINPLLKRHHKKVIAISGFFDVEAECDIITTVIGENAILPCRLITKHLPPSMELQWRKVGPGKDKTIYLYLYDESSPLLNSYPRDDKCSMGYLSPNGVNSREWLTKKYEKKAEVSKGKEFGKGNISLKLNNIQVEDEGKYVCSATANSFHREIIIEVLIKEAANMEFREGVLQVKEEQIQDPWDHPGDNKCACLLLFIAVIIILFLVKWKKDLEKRMKQLQEEKEQLQEEKGKMEKTIKQLQEEKGDLEKRMKQLQEEKGEMEKIIRDLEKRMREMEKIIKELLDQMGDLEKRMRDLEKTMREMEKTIKELQEEKEQLQEEKGEMEKTIKELQEEKGEMENTIRDLEKRMKQLQEENGEMEKIIKQLQEEKEDLQAENEELQEEKGEMEKTIKDLQAENGEMEKTIKKPQEQMEEMEKTIREMEKTIKDLQKKKDELQEEKEEPQEQMGKMEKTIKLLQEEKGEMEKTIKEPLEQMGEKEKIIKDLQAQNGEMEKTIKELQEEKEKPQEQMGEMEKTIREMEKTIEQLQEEKGEMEKTIKDLQKEKDELQEEKGEMEKTIEDLKAENGEMEKTINELQEEKEEPQEQMELLQEEKGEMEKTIKEPLEQMGEKEKIIKQLQEEKGEMEKTIKELQEEKGEMEKTIEQPQEQMGEMEKTIKQLQEEKGEMEKTIKDLQKEKEDLKAENGEMEKTINELQEEKEELQEEKEQPQEQMGEMERTIREMEKTIKQLQEEKGEMEKTIKKLQEKKDEMKKELEWRRAQNNSDDITLHGVTAHPNLSISVNKKSFTHEAQPQKVPANPERFDSTVCVLGSEGFSSGKHYWEVEVVSSKDWDLGVARNSIQRKGKLSLSPKEGFWALGLSGRDYWAKTDPWTRVVVQKKPKKIGVYLSYQEGQVTFFNVTDMSVLFTFNDCSFPEEVYPFFKNSHKETTMRICSIKDE